MSAEIRSMPQITLGDARLSRLILGANTINAGSHLSRFVNEQMRAYFDEAQVQALLAACGAQGINTWQAGPANLEQLRRYREGGGEVHFISLAAEEYNGPEIVETLAAAGTLGVAHHGEMTDVLYKRGELDSIVPFLKKVRDAGMQVGISTHMPAVVDYVESKGWDVDFYMTCVYERHRTREELKALLGHVPLPVREVYLEEDPPRMYAAIQATERTCLAFKILAAGRLCDKQETVEEAFEATLSAIKPQDGVIVGIYPRFEDQVSLDADYVRRYSALGAH